MTLGRSLFLTESGWNSSVSCRYLCFNVFFPLYVICHSLYVIFHDLDRYFMLNILYLISYFMIHIRQRLRRVKKSQNKVR